MKLRSLFTSLRIIRLSKISIERTFYALRLILSKFVKCVASRNKSLFLKAGVYDFENFVKTFTLTFSLTLVLLEILLYFTTKNVFILFLPLFTPIFIILILKATLLIKIHERKSRIEINMHKFLLVMLVFSKARLNILEIAKNIAQSRIDVISDEFVRIYYKIKYGGINPKAALLEAAENSPSDKFSDILRGIVGLLESGGNLSRYIEDRLKDIEVERKVWMQSYLEKLSVMLDSYIVLAIVLPVLLFCINITKSVSGIMVPFEITYILMIIVGAILCFALYSLSPEKTSDFEKIKPVLLLVFPFITLMINFQSEEMKRLIFLLFVLLFSSISSFFTIKSFIEDSRISRSLVTYISKVLGYLEAGKDKCIALKLALKDESKFIKKYLESTTEKLRMGYPCNKVFLELENKSKNEDLRILARILSKTCIIGYLKDVLLGYLNEMSRLNMFRKERDSIIRMHGIAMIVIFIVFIFISFIISSKLLPVFERMVDCSLFSIKVEKIKDYIADTIIMLSVAISTGWGAAKGDLRLIPPVLLFLSIITTIFVCKFLYGFI